MLPHDDIPERDATGLRQFGLVTAGMIAVLFGLFFPWLFSKAFSAWPWLIAGALAAWALAHPSSLNPVYRSWMRLGLAVGWVSSRLVLGLLFYLIFTPAGWIMRLKGHDPMARAFEPSAPTYRKTAKHRSIQHMERPF